MIPDTPAEQLKPIPPFGGFAGLALGMSPRQVRDKSPVAITKLIVPESLKRWKSTFRGWDVSVWTAEKFPIYEKKTGLVHFVFLDSHLACVDAELGHVNPGEYFDWVKRIQKATGDKWGPSIEKYGPNFEENTARYTASLPHKPFSILFAGGLLDYRTAFDEKQKNSFSQICLLDPEVRKKWDVVYSEPFEGIEVYSK